MARKYKIHQFYAVIWHNQATNQWYRDDMLTKRKARIISEYVTSYPDNDYVEVVRRLIAMDRKRGELDIEAL